MSILFLMSKNEHVNSHSYLDMHSFHLKQYSGLFKKENGLTRLVKFETIAINLTRDEKH